MVISIQLPFTLYNISMFYTTIQIKIKYYVYFLYLEYNLNLNVNIISLFNLMLLKMIPNFNVKNYYKLFFWLYLTFSVTTFMFVS